MPRKSPCVLESRHLRIEIDPADLAAHVTVKSTGETLRMAPAQPDDVLIVRSGTQRWASFTEARITLRKRSPARVDATLAGLNLQVRITLEDEDLIFEVAPGRSSRDGVPRDVLYPRHFLLPRNSDAYATFPFGQGSIIPATETSLFHHREGYAEAYAHWFGGYTGRTGYCAIAETPDDLYQAVDHRPDSPASVFFHWLGSHGELRYPRRVRYRFAKGLDYVRQAKVYREYCRKVGIFRSLEDKAKENPNVLKLVGAPLVTSMASIRREKSFTYQVVKFTQQAEWIERFREKTGIENALVHIDGWGYWGYDSMHPDTLPPNPDCGGVEGLAELARRVKALGYLFALHDQYIDMYAHAPSFDENQLTVTEDGRPVRVNRWAGGLCGHLCYTFIPDFLRRNLFTGVRRTYPIYHNSPSVWQIAQPTAYYLDCFCRTVECWSREHPLTRSESRRMQNEIFKIARAGADGRGIVLSVEHPRDFAIPYIDSAWSNGHLSADIVTTTGDHVYRAVGIPVPLWHLVFHDALHLPTPNAPLIEGLLYGQVPRFRLEGGRLPTAREITRAKVLIALHQDVALLEMTDHKILNPDGSAQKCVFAGGIEVEVDKKAGTYRISDGRAKTKGFKKL